MTWFLLQMVDHGQAMNEVAHYGGFHVRFLNATGRWSATGSRAVPLLGWKDMAEAQGAASAASKARSRVIDVAAVSDQDAGVVQGMSGHDVHAALSGYLPYAPAAAKAMAIEVDKTMQYASAVLAVLGPDCAIEPGLAARTVAQGLRSQFGGGSVVSAAQFLTGRKAYDVLSRVLEGEVPCAPGMSQHRLVLAFAIASAVVDQLRRPQVGNR